MCLSGMHIEKEMLMIPGRSTDKVVRSCLDRAMHVISAWHITMSTAGESCVHVVNASKWSLC
jgi:hypothetical protein